MSAFPPRTAAYTRTSILRRFLDLIAESAPSRIDGQWVQHRLELKGGDVRACQQSLRVLGLVDDYGELTDAGRRSRSLEQRPSVMQEALWRAYPELSEQWQMSGGMLRHQVEDFFKLQYGLSASTGGPAAKLFCDLKREFDRPEQSAGLTRPGEPPSAPAPTTAGRGAPQRAAPATDNDVRIAAAEALKSALQVHITSDWDQERLTLALDRVERMMRMLLPSGGG